MPKSKFATQLISERRWQSIEGAASHYAVSQKTIRRLISSGQITGYRVGPRLIRIDLNEVDATLHRIPTVGGER